MAFVTKWNQTAQKFFQTGIDRPVLYLRDATGAYPLGVPWEGFISCNEKPAGAEQTKLWANNAQYATLVAAETFGGTVKAYHYPPEWDQANGALEAVVGEGLILNQQPRVSFGLSYRTYIGTQAAGATSDYQIHILYGCLAKPSEAERATINDTVNAAEFSWDFECTAENVTGFEPVAHIVLDSRTMDPTTLQTIETQLYGDDGGTPVTPNLPLPDALIAMLP